MTFDQFKKLVSKHSGWLEDGAARFPSVWCKEQFEKEAERIELAAYSDAMNRNQSRRDYAEQFGG